MAKEKSSKSKKKDEEVEIATYIYSFEIIHHYPNVRKFLIQRPLKSSFKDTFTELFFGNKK